MLVETPSFRREGGEPLEVLSRVFGFAAFRGLQDAAISQVMTGGDALVLMPTGGGKSLCYQIPALCRPGMGLVVSPLIALMDDQVAALRQLGVNAAALHSELSPEDAPRVKADFAAGRLDLLYVSPERLLSPGMLDRLGRQQISVIAIDEAHCVSQWGHEFRPEYRALAGLPQALPGVPRIALTATADPRTRVDILQALAMPEAEVLAASFHRPNLHIAAKPKASELGQLTDMLGRHKAGGGASIVYCGSRNKTERIARSLRERDWPAIVFHAGISPLEKRAALARFRSGEPVVVVATIAFGMGIDRPDVRIVVHLDMPDSPEGYYQQIGRAGRDGEPAQTLLLYGGEDIARARHWLDVSTAPPAQKKVMGQRLESMIALTDTTGCRTRALLACFGETLGQDCGHCDNCRTPIATFDGTIAAQKALSAIYRTGQRFGAMHIVSVLRGKQTDMVTRHQHDRLPLYGIGKEHPEGFWRSVIRQLVSRGALQTGEGEYATLALNEAVARPILRGEQKLMLREDAVDPVAGSGRAGAGRAPRERGDAAREMAASDLGGDALLRFETLREWRREEARTQSVPPYVIFHDSVLRDIASQHPADLAALGQVKGVGASKLERYGPQVLASLKG
ncbi:DNA helicase RecQ [Lichenicoccus roseus]|uniref:DNA helicase RecQ n=1 Tax=Lichenicoccus roseus TaxID=2683649 RepID=A0A5R9J483_9PROT|nr:DNA helicase RecQ [Lichenicoccus roseus]TLU72435.1 DNA helicase RecQ [Lichenicoccus roseus]